MASYCADVLFDLVYRMIETKSGKLSYADVLIPAVNYPTLINL